MICEHPDVVELNFPAFFTLSYTERDSYKLECTIIWSTIGSHLKVSKAFGELLQSSGGCR